MFIHHPVQTASGIPILRNRLGTIAYTAIHHDVINHLAKTGASGSYCRHFLIKVGKDITVPMAKPRAKCSDEWAI